MSTYTDGLLNGIAITIMYVYDTLPLSEKDKKRLRNKGIIEILKTKGYGEETAEELVIRYIGLE